MKYATNLLSHCYLTIEGAPPPESFYYDLISVNVENSLHLPDVATIVIEDTKLRWVDNDIFKPGKSITITARTKGPSQTLFQGEVVEIEPCYHESALWLTIRAFDQLHRLTRGRFARSFQNVTDTDLVKHIAGEVGLSVTAKETSYVHPYVFQANESNLAFLRKRAAAIGFLLYVQRGILFFHPFEEQAPDLKLKWSDDLIEFRPRLTTLKQVSKVIVRGWNPQEKHEIVGQASSSQSSPSIGIQKNGGALASDSFQLEAPLLITDIPVRNQSKAQSLAESEADRHESLFIEAEGKCIGNPKLIAGTTLDIQAVGNRFSGTYFTTSTSHYFSEQESYITRFNVTGHHTDTLLRYLEREKPSTRLSSCAIGVVTDIEDPEKLGRIKVKFPWLAPQHNSNWARVASVGGGSQRGIQWLPEVNDEVLVGFELGDIHHPYIISGLWNHKDEPPGKEVVDQGLVKKRLMVSRTGHTIILDDSEDRGAITIKDRNQNEITISTNTDNLLIKVKGDINIEAGGAISMTANSTIKLKAQRIDLN